MDASEVAREVGPEEVDVVGAVLLLWLCESDDAFASAGGASIGAFTGALGKKKIIFAL